MKGNTLLFVSYFFTLIVLFALLILALIFQDLPSPYGTTFNPFDRYAPYFAPLVFLSIVAVVCTFAISLARIARMHGKIMNDSDLEITERSLGNLMGILNLIPEEERITKQYAINLVSKIIANHRAEMTHIPINKISSKQYPLMFDTDLPIRFFWNQDGSFDGIEVHVEGLSERNQQLVEELCKIFGESLGIEHSYSVVADDEENEEKKE